MRLACLASSGRCCGCCCCCCSVTSSGCVLRVHRAIAFSIVTLRLESVFPRRLLSPEGGCFRTARLKSSAASSRDNAPATRISSSMTADDVIIATASLYSLYRSWRSGAAAGEVPSDSSASPALTSVADSSTPESRQNLRHNTSPTKSHQNHSETVNGR